jgi:hypothetical protein
MVAVAVAGSWILSKLVFSVWWRFCSWLVVVLFLVVGVVVWWFGGLVALVCDCRLVSLAVVCRNQFLPSLKPRLSICVWLEYSREYFELEIVRSRRSCSSSLVGAWSQW